MYNTSYFKVKPTQRDFEVNIISRHPEFEGQTLKKYNLDGIETIGAYGDEPFEIQFKNNSSETVQIRVSVDGTDIMTAKPATLEITHEMFLIRAHNSITLKAWHETNMGGARFVFTNEQMGVAKHAHGDITHKGIIAVAVYTEGDRTQPIYRTQENFMRRATGGAMKSASSGSSVQNYGSLYGSISKGATGAMGPSGAASADELGEVHSSNSVDGAYYQGDLRRDVDAAPAAAAGQLLNSSRSKVGLPLKKTSAAVGAGEYVEQRTRTVEGLKKPELNSVLRTRYMWWDEVVAHANEQYGHVVDIHPTGFPADPVKKFADLSGVPRVESAAKKNPPVRISNGDFYRFV